MGVEPAIFFLVLLGLHVQAHPVNEKDADSSCIAMTPERAEEIKKIGEEFNRFIQDLTDKYEDIDFTMVEVTIENHSEDEEDEKETMLKVLVNDCKDNDKKYKNKEERYFESDHPHLENTISDKDNVKNSENETPNKSVDENSENETRDNTNDDGNSDEETDDENDVENSENESQDDKIEDNSENKSDKSTENQIKNEETIKEESSQDIISKKETVATKDDHSSNSKTKINDESSATVKKSDEKKIISENTESKDDSIKDIDDVSRDQQKENVDTRMTKNYNFNGDHGNSNVFIYAPKIDNWNIKSEDSYDSYSNSQPHINLRKLISNRNANNYVAELLKLYNTLPIINIEPAIAENVDLRVFKDGDLTKLKRADKNSNNYVYGLMKTFGLLDGNES